MERERQRMVERDNEVYFRKLEDIKREAPATYHAPNGYSSLRVRRSSVCPIYRSRAQAQACVSCRFAGCARMCWTFVISCCLPLDTDNPVALQKGGAMRALRPDGAKRRSLMTGTCTHVDVARWPPKADRAVKCKAEHPPLTSQLQPHMRGGNILLPDKLTQQGRHDLQPHAQRSHAPHSAQGCNRECPNQAERCASGLKHALAGRVL